MIPISSHRQIVFSKKGNLISKREIDAPEITFCVMIRKRNEWKIASEINLTTFAEKETHFQKLIRLKLAPLEEKIRNAR